MNEALSRRERVIRALRHEETDFVPYHIDLTSQAEAKLVTYTGKAHPLADCGGHIHMYQYCGWPTETEPGSERFLDAFGVTWNRSGVDKDIGVVDAPVVNRPDASLFCPVLDEARLRREVEDHIRTAEDRFVAIGIGFSMFERFWSLQGMEDALANMLLEPEFTDELLDKICEYDLAVLEILLEYPIDAVYFGDDWGQQKGLIMGKPLWLRFIAPRMRRLYARVKQAGKFVVQHSCGDISELFGDLIDMGLDCYQTFQPEIYDIQAIKQQYGNKLSFWGGISTQRVLPFATPEEIRAETRRLIGILGKGGGYIVAPTHAVPGDVPPENILAMLDVMGKA